MGPSGVLVGAEFGEHVEAECPLAVQLEELHSTDETQTQNIAPAAGN